MFCHQPDIRLGKTHIQIEGRRQRGAHRVAQLVEKDEGQNQQRFTQTIAMDELMKQSPDIMLNLSASPFDYTHDEDRKATIKANVLKYKIPLFYCNAVGSQTEIVFDGGSLVYAADGELKHELNYFSEDGYLTDTEQLIGSVEKD